MCFQAISVNRFRIWSKGATSQENQLVVHPQFHRYNMGMLDNDLISWRKQATGEHHEEGFPALFSHSDAIIVAYQQVTPS